MKKEKNFIYKLLYPLFFINYRFPYQYKKYRYNNKAILVKTGMALYCVQGLSPLLGNQPIFCIWVMAKAYNTCTKNAGGFHSH